MPLAAAAVHGLILGWSDYWLGVYGWRAEEDLGRGLGARLDDLSDQISRIAPDVWGVALVALVGLAVSVRRRRALWIAPCWLVACFLAINAGGLYLPHYFLQLLPPLALLAAIAAGAAYARSPVLAVALVCLAVAPVAVTLGDYATMSPRQREAAIRWNRRYNEDVDVARFIRAHSGRRDQLVALPSRADLYFLANRLPPIPYLWEHTPLVRPSTIVTLRRKLSGAGRPRFVVVVRGARDIDSSGRLKRVVARYYRQVWAPPGAPDLRVLLARAAVL